MPPSPYNNSNKNNSNIINYNNNSDNNNSNNINYYNNSDDSNTILHDHDVKWDEVKEMMFVSVQNNNII